MKLRVNGVDVPVSDRLEISIEVDGAGETLGHGIAVDIRGGQLSVHAMDGRPAAFEMEVDRTVYFKGGEVVAASMVTNDPNPPRIPHGGALPFEGDQGSARFTGRDGENPVLYLESDAHSRRDEPPVL